MKTHFCYQYFQEFSLPYQNQFFCTESGENRKEKALVPQGMLYIYAVINPISDSAIFR